MSLINSSPNKLGAVKLTKGRYAYCDLEDLEFLNQYRWHARSSKGNWYAETQVKGRSVFMHNLLIGRRVGLEVDHINQDGLDNRKPNLRHSTRSQNRANVKPRKDNKSGFKGVCFYKPTSKWRAYIRVDRRWKQLGYFTSAVEAAKTYNEAALEAFGEFAWLNPIP